MSKKEKDLRICPCCASGLISWVKSSKLTRKGSRVCDDCGLSTKEYPSKKKATEAWNCRNAEIILRRSMERMETDRHWFTLEEMKPQDEQHIDIYDPMGSRWPDVIYRGGRFLYDQMNEQYLLERDVILWHPVPNLPEIRSNRKRAEASKS